MKLTIMLILKFIKEVIYTLIFLSFGVVLGFYLTYLLTISNAINPPTETITEHDRIMLNHIIEGN